MPHFVGARVSSAFSVDAVGAVGHAALRQTRIPPTAPHIRIRPPAAPPITVKAVAVFPLLERLAFGLSLESEGSGCDEDIKKEKHECESEGSQKIRVKKDQEKKLKGEA